MSSEGGSKFLVEPGRHDVPQLGQKGGHDIMHEEMQTMYNGISDNSSEN